MSNKLTCSVVQDLLPQYVEKLLSPETEKAVRKHLEECETCREIHRQMNDPEPVPAEDVQEVDYLKKVRRGRRRILVGALVAALVIGIGSFFLLRKTLGKAPDDNKAAQPTAPETVYNYNKDARTIVVYGKGDGSDLKLTDVPAEAKYLDAQFDSYHLSLYLPVLKNGGEDLGTYLPAFFSRTNQSLHFLRAYLAENCSEQYPAEAAEKYLEISVSDVGNYSWTEEEDRIWLEMGSYYWHREELYLLSLMNCDHVEWEQLGYVWYVGACLDPYSETLSTTNFNIMKDQPYGDAFLRAGGTTEATPENFRKFTDAVAWYCLNNGMNWGSPYESSTLRHTSLYSGPAKSPDPGNDMSVSMAASFIAYLADQYGFEQVSAFCFDRASFSQAFGTDYQTARDAWAAWLQQTCGEG